MILSFVHKTKKPSKCWSQIVIINWGKRYLYNDENSFAPVGTLNVNSECAKSFNVIAGWWYLYFVSIANFKAMFEELVKYKVHTQLIEYDTGKYIISQYVYSAFYCKPKWHFLQRGLVN